MNNSPYIVAVIPAFNEGTRIGSVVGDAKKYVNQVVVVDDGSRDNTAEKAKEAGADVVRHIDNSGAGAATMTGIEAARILKADIVITLDADEQHDPKEIPKLIKPLLENRADIVFANRFGQKNAIPFIRRLFNGIGNIITLVATGIWVPDSQSGYKAFGPKAIKQIHLRMSGFEFCTEIIREVGQYKWKMVHIPVKVMYSEYTLSKGQSFSGGIRTALKILLRSFLR